MEDYGILIPTEIVPADSVVWIRKGEKDTAAALDKALRELIASGKLLEIAKANRLLNTAFIEEQQKTLSAAR